MNVYLNKFVLLLALAGAINLAVLAQAKAKTECPEETSKLARFVEAESKAEAIPPVEKAIASDARPTVKFCVSDASVSVRGWRRNEVRALVEGGGKLGFRVAKRNSDNVASYVTIVGYDPKEPAKPGQARRSECLTGSNIEVEVPFGAYVDVSSPRDAEFKIESVAKTRVVNVSGNILVRDVREEADISSFDGNVVAEDSNGRIRLKSTSGNVFGIRLKPLNDSDALRANSNSGNVTLQDVAHGVIEGGSQSSNFNYFGALVSGGVYDFKTLNGTITLFLPLKSSFQLNATTNSNLQSNLPQFKPTINGKPGQIKRISGVYGDGNAIINLVSLSGPLRLQRQPVN
ncbi:MAG: DUF4097 domain-containing protein [Acidobacteriota bacterium]|nr:DUF4097 domain-containing protein [Acidobacteriota bacterium]